MSIDSRSSLLEVAFVVCTALDRVGMTAVLSGGGAATVYAPEVVQSLDLDFIVLSGTRHGAQAARALLEIGFTEARDHYEHPQSPFLLEFPPGPLTVGGELITSWDTLRSKGRLLHVLSPTDACRDRLAAFLHWNDRGSLEQAVAVARVQRPRLDLSIIRTWCAREGREDRFEEFRRRIEAGT